MVMAVKEHLKSICSCEQKIREAQLTLDKMLQEKGYNQVQLIKDLSGKDRIIKAYK